MRLAIALVVLATVLLGAPSTASAEGGDCSQASREAGTCPSVTGTITDDEAVLDGTQGGSGGGGGAGATATETETDDVEPGCVVTPSNVCRNQFTVVEMPTPTLSDLVGFRPTPGVDHMEPNGWFVVGLDANFYVTGGTSVQGGTLLGYPASVRFTPIRWSWQYGDGQTATRATPGATWAAQHLGEFDPTSTSHVYTAAGTYYIDLTIGYRAEYNFAGAGWAPIQGILWLPANRLVATVGGAKTVLVEQDCTTSRSGPGC